MSDHPIVARWTTVRAAHRTALIPYLTAGHPSRSGTIDALRMLEAEGADFIELGIPFSDPMADGPVIQRSTHAALEAGMSVEGALQVAIEAALSVPVIAFSYLNPLLAYGIDRFLTEAWSAGISGVLITDLPGGADPELDRQLQAGPLAVIRLVAPTTAPARLPLLLRGAGGFVYLIARRGVTGPETVVGDELRSAAAAIREVSGLPVAVGFGIRRAEQARQLATFADGIVVGSALVERLERGIDPARGFVRDLRSALDATPVG